VINPDEGSAAAEWPADLSIISILAASTAVVEAAATPIDRMTGARPSEKNLADLAMSRLQSVGLNALPTWLLPWGALSNGQV